MGVERNALEPAAAVPGRLQRQDASHASGAGASGAVLGLQRSAGNHAVSGLLQRASYGPKASGAPATWSDDVKKATTAADRCKLVGTALTGVTVVDKTADCAGDAAVDAKHLVAYDSSKPTVSYDDNLNSKSGRSSDAGFTKSPGGKGSYVVLGPKALRDSDFFFTRLIVNHEFNHVRQNTAGSSLKGNDSEVDAWTSSFVSEFHRAYRIEESGGKPYIDDYQTFTQLLGYYEKSDVSATVKADCVKRIEDYYAATIAPHKIHTAVFRFWLHRTLKGGTFTALATKLNADLKLGVDPTADLKTTRQLDPADVKGATFPSGTTVSAP